MNIIKMNESLQGLLQKYAVKLDGKLVEKANRVELQLSDGKIAKLLPWREERKFVELKKLIDDNILEDVSTLRFSVMSNSKNLEYLLYKELDLCSFLGKSPVVSTFAVQNGNVANVIAKLADGKNCSIECSAQLPAKTQEQERHEIIARRGIACDQVVDTQVAQSSIYKFTDDGETRYTDIDMELFGFSNSEILVIRAAFELLQHPEKIEIWNKADVLLEKIVKDTLEFSAKGMVAKFEEEK